MTGIPIKLDGCSNQPIFKRLLLRQEPFLPRRIFGLTLTQFNEMPGKTCYSGEDIGERSIEKGEIV